MSKLIAKISLKTTEESLREHFEQFGEVISVKIIPRHGVNLGEIEVKNAEEMLAKSNMTGLDGRVIKVFSVEQKEKEKLEEIKKYNEKLKIEKEKQKLEKKESPKKLRPKIKVHKEDIVDIKRPIA